MSSVLNKIVDALHLKSTRMYYEVQRYRQIKSLRPDFDNPKYKDILQALDRDGIHIIPDFMDREACEKLVQTLDRSFDQVKNGTYTGPYQYDNNKLIRLGDVTEHVPETRVFFENPMFDEIAKSYIDPRAYSYRREAELRDNVGTHQQGDIPHFDDWRMRFKYFLYLTDVGPDNAPFTYFKNTHKDEPWKYRKNFEYERDGEYGSYGHYFPQEMVALKNSRKVEEVVCTGTAGTLIIADFRGLHCGTMLRAGRRILLNSTYGI